LARGDAAGAIADLDRLLKRTDAPTRALFIRSQAREALGDKAAAEADRREGLARIPRDEMSWVTRGLNRLPLDPAGALEDFRAARSLNPRSLPALRNEARLLAEMLGRTEDGVKALDEAIAQHPQSGPVLNDRSVLLARLGRRDEAVRDAEAALSLDDSAETLYRVSCTYALTSTREPGDASEALRLLALAARKDGSWLSKIDADPDLAPLRDRPEYRRLRDALGVVFPPPSGAR
jgi:tetratricopeptide (TPR) repeat protein